MKKSKLLVIPALLSISLATLAGEPDLKGVCSMQNLDKQCSTTFAKKPTVSGPTPAVSIEIVDTYNHDKPFSLVCTSTIPMDFDSPYFKLYSNQFNLHPSLKNKSDTQITINFNPDPSSRGVYTPVALIPQKASAGQQGSLTCVAQKN